MSELGSIGTISTPINTLLLLLITYYAHRIILPSTPSSNSKSGSEIPSDYKQTYSWMPKSHPPSVVYQRFTPRSLSRFDGRNGERILLGIKGVVFDVSAGRSFYGPDGPYGNFAGRDASRGMAKQSFDPEVLTPIDQPLDKLEDLTPSEIENMNGWIEHFTNKYIVCGELVDNTD